MNLEKVVEDTIRKYRLFQKGERVVVGVSGGPDSLALLYVLNTLKEKWKVRLCIAHLDHGLRKDSSKDRLFVERLCRKLKLPLCTSRVNLKGLPSKGSLEEVARNARFRFLFQVARRLRAQKIALGHNLDDQAETVMMRILRGTGLFGLGGILPKREISGFQVIRPLIEVKRRDINAYLRQRKVKPCLDPTNQMEVHFRNRIRKCLLPYLEKRFNRNMKDVLSHLARTCAQDYDYLNQASLKALEKVSIGQSKLDLKRFRALHPSLQRLVLRLMVCRIQGDLRRLTFKHIQELEDLLLNRPIGSLVDLPKGILVLKKKTCLQFLRK